MDPKKRSSIIVRTSVIGIVANVLLVGFKATVGLLSNSIAIVLDAVNNLTDALSSIVAILGTKLAGRRPDREHPMGHGRYEYLSAIVIIAIVLYAGVTALVESGKKVIQPETPDYSMAALIVVASAVVVKIALGRYVSAKGRQTNSSSLVASGKDALFDAIISASVLAAAIVYLLTGFNLEAYVGLAISAVIIKAGFDMLRETLDDILGSRPDSALSQGIKRTVCADEDVMGAYDLLLESYGPDLTLASVHVEVADTMTAAQIDAMTRRLQSAVYAEHRIALATVGIYSHNTTDDEVIEMRSVITRTVMSHEGVLQMHGFFADSAEKHASFDVIISFDLDDRRALHRQICEEVEALYPEYTFNIALDRDLSD